MIGLLPFLFALVIASSAAEAANPPALAIGALSAFVAASLAAAAVGDMAIEFDLIAGAVAFFVYHTVALLLFLRHRGGPLESRDSLIFIALLLGTPFVAYFLPYDDGMRLPIAIYALALGAMAAGAWASDAPALQAATARLIATFLNMLLSRRSQRPLIARRRRGTASSRVQFSYCIHNPLPSGRAQGQERRGKARVLSGEPLDRPMKPANAVKGAAKDSAAPKRSAKAAFRIYPPRHNPGKDLGRCCREPFTSLPHARSFSGTARWARRRWGRPVRRTGGQASPRRQAPRRWE